MPIEVQTAVQLFNKEQYHALNRRVLGFIFEIHNDFGRLLDEGPFKCELVARCAEVGIAPIEREVRVRVTHDGYEKVYRIDLLLAHGFLLEVKAHAKIVPADRTQTLTTCFWPGCRMAHWSTYEGSSSNMNSFPRI